MNNKVYLLISGYADMREVVAVYSTLEAAQAALRFGDDRTTIAEFPLDAPLPEAPAGHSLWSVSEDTKEFHAFRTLGFQPEEDGAITCEEGGVYTGQVWAMGKEDATRKGVALIEAFKAKQGPNA